jgi:two-component system NarL family sensor kinase
MRVSVDAPLSLPRLSAAIEVAAYRIATEAVTNSARHSGTDMAAVKLDLSDGCLTITVRDPGPVVPAWVSGVGISSMRERAAEVGGTLHITTDEEGSMVRALLPLG